MLKVVKKKCRVHSLTGRITLLTLKKAFKAVKKNRGVAGIDKQSIKMFESNLDENLMALMRQLKDRSYLPIPLKGVYIPKGKTKLRPLGIRSCSMSGRSGNDSFLDKPDIRAHFS